MSAALMILMQAAAATPGAPLPRDFDLRDHLQLREVPLAIGDRCASDDPAVIVVCATRSDDTYRLGPTAPAGSGPPQAETRLGDGFRHSSVRRDAYTYEARVARSSRYTMGRAGLMPIFVSGWSISHVR